MLGVAAEDLVAPLAREHHLHGAPGFPRESVDRDVGGLAHGRVAEGHQPRQLADQVLGVDHQLVVLGAAMPRHGRRVAQLAVLLLGEAHEKVFTCGLERFMSATIIEESMPPDRKAPKGTSLTICTRTASSSFARKPPTSGARSRAPVARLAVGGASSSAPRETSRAARRRSSRASACGRPRRASAAPGT